MKLHFPMKGWAPTCFEKEANGNLEMAHCNIQRVQTDKSVFSLPADKLYKSRTALHYFAQIVQCIPLSSNISHTTLKITLLLFTRFFVNARL